MTTARTTATGTIAAERTLADHPEFLLEQGQHSGGGGALQTPQRDVQHHPPPDHAVRQASSRRRRPGRTSAACGPNTINAAMTSGVDRMYPRRGWTSASRAAPGTSRRASPGSAAGWPPAVGRSRRALGPGTNISTAASEITMPTRHAVHHQRNRVGVSRSGTAIGSIRASRRRRRPRPRTGSPQAPVQRKAAPHGQIGARIRRRWRGGPLHPRPPGGRRRRRALHRHAPGRDRPGSRRST